MIMYVCLSVCLCGTNFSNTSGPPARFLVLVMLIRILLVQVASVEAKLAIFFTYFFPSSFFLSTSTAFHPLWGYRHCLDNFSSRCACVCHPWWRMKRSWSLFSPTLVFSFFFLRLLLFIYFGETPVTENLFPPIFWHN